LGLLVSIENFWFFRSGGNGVAGRHSEWLIDKPTLVIGRVGALCGNVYATEGGVWVTDNAIYAKEIAPKVNLRFVSLVYTWCDLNANAGGSGQPFVNQTTLDSVVIPLPPLIEQIEIVRRFDALSSIADSLEIGWRLE
jgi:type I restriction enzyme S subunit